MGTGQTVDLEDTEDLNSEKMNRMTQSRKQTNYVEEVDTKNKAGTKQTHMEFSAVGNETQNAKQ